MLLFPAANDLLTMFVALEVLSLPLYLLCGLARRRRLLSQEAALKYFLLGAFSSGFFLYGVALIYGFAGSMQLADINEAVRNDTGNQALLLIGMGMLAVGLLFKVGAVPFQAWTPDVYQGAPTAVTAFMAACTKIAAFGALLRLFYVAFGGDRWDWQPMIWIDRDPHHARRRGPRDRPDRHQADAGLLLDRAHRLPADRAARRPGAGELADHEITSLQAVLFYLATYGFATIGAFAVVTAGPRLRRRGDALSNAGPGSGKPLAAGRRRCSRSSCSSMAGIPLTGGFIGKWAVFTVAALGGRLAGRDRGDRWPAIVAVFFYVRVIVLMFFAEPVEGERRRAVPEPSLLTSATIARRRRRDPVPGRRARARCSTWPAHAGAFIR